MFHMDWAGDRSYEVPMTMLKKPVFRVLVEFGCKAESATLVLLVNVRWYNERS
jgi:hypothetical protein